MLREILAFRARILMPIETDNRQDSHLHKKSRKRGLGLSDIRRRQAHNEIGNASESLHRDTMLWLGAAALIVAFRELVFVLFSDSHLG